jgi:hypothetical protein
MHVCWVVAPACGCGVLPLNQSWSSSARGCGFYIQLNVGSDPGGWGSASQRIERGEVKGMGGVATTSTEKAATGRRSGKNRDRNASEMHWSM